MTKTKKKINTIIVILIVIGLIFFFKTDTTPLFVSEDTRVPISLSKFQIEEADLGITPIEHVVAPTFFALYPGGQYADYCCDTSCDRMCSGPHDWCDDYCNPPGGDEEEKICPSGYVKVTEDSCCPNSNPNLCDSNGLCYEISDCGAGYIGTQICKTDSGGSYLAEQVWGETCAPISQCVWGGNGPGSCPSAYLAAGDPNYGWCKYPIWHMRESCESCSGDLCVNSDQCTVGEISCDGTASYSKCESFKPQFYANPYNQYTSKLYLCPEGEICFDGRCGLIQDCVDLGFTTMSECIDWINENIDILQLSIMDKINLIKQLDITVNEKIIMIQQLTDNVAEQLQYISQLDLTIVEQKIIIEEYKLTIAEQASYIQLLDLSVLEQAQQIAAFELTLEEQAVFLQALELSVQEQATFIQALELSITEQATIINQLTINLQEKAVLVDQLTVTSQEQADLIAQMELSFSDQGVIIDALQNTILEDITLISALTDENTEQAEILNGMQLTLDEQVALITGLKSTLSDQAEIISHMELTVQEQAEIISNMELTNEEQAVLISKLTANIEEQAEIIANLEVSVGEQESIIAALKLTLQEEEELIQKLLEEQGERKFEFKSTYIWIILGALIYIVWISRKR